MKVSIALINLYQSYISPYKGFRCAYGVVHNGESCSVRVKGVIGEVGLIRGWSAIVNQFKECRMSSELLKDQNDNTSQVPWEERKKKKLSDGSGCLLLPAACAIPDPSDCALGGVAEAGTGVCGSIGEVIGGACSCL